jgi:hypothetical protein
MRRRSPCIGAESAARWSWRRRPPRARRTSGTCRRRSATSARRSPPCCRRRQAPRARGRRWIRRCCSGRCVSGAREAARGRRSLVRRTRGQISCRRARPGAAPSWGRASVLSCSWRRARRGGSAWSAQHASGRQEGSRRHPERLSAAAGHPERLLAPEWRRPFAARSSCARRGHVSPGVRMGAPHRARGRTRGSRGRGRAASSLYPPPTEHPRALLAAQQQADARRLPPAPRPTQQGPSSAPSQLGGVRPARREVASAAPAGRGRQPARRRRAGAEARGVWAGAAIVEAGRRRSGIRSGGRPWRARERRAAAPAR